VDGLVGWAFGGERRPGGPWLLFYVVRSFGFGYGLLPFLEELWRRGLPGVSVGT